MKNLRILCIHGIGGKDASMSDSYGWVKDWRGAFTEMELTTGENVRFMKFDSFFNGGEIGWSEYVEFFKTTFIQTIALRKHQKGIKEWFDYYPDMAVEFLLNKNGIREVLNQKLKETIKAENPDVIYAHSLGSMLCYDFFTRPENNGYGNIILVTAGSQLGNPKLQNHSLK